jgi:hypothetical protein
MPRLPHEVGIDCTTKLLRKALQLLRRPLQACKRAQSLEGIRRRARNQVRCECRARGGEGQMIGSRTWRTPRLLALGVAGALALGVVACGDDDEESGGGGGSGSAQEEITVGLITKT